MPGTRRNDELIHWPNQNCARVISLTTLYSTILIGPVNSSLRRVSGIYDMSKLKKYVPYANTADL